jgi:hypothetical protein
MFICAAHNLHAVTYSKNLASSGRGGRGESTPNPYSRTRKGGVELDSRCWGLLRDGGGDEALQRAQRKPRLIKLTHELPKRLTLSLRWPSVWLFTSIVPDRRLHARNWSADNSRRLPCVAPWRHASPHGYPIRVCEDRWLCHPCVGYVRLRADS